ASVADCVPASIVDPARRVVAVVHAGWRGTAGGILEAALGELARSGSDPAALRVHFGPAICGDCYEVGPEVHAAVNPALPAPEAPAPIDLRAALARRATGAGAPAERVTI